MHKMFFVRYGCSISAIKLNARAVKVAIADPAIPKRGTGPKPKIGKGSSAIPGNTDTAR